MSCKDSARQTADSSKTIEPIPVPRFSGDSAYQYVEDQLAMGVRVPGTAGHAATKEYLVDKLKTFGGKVHIQNIEASRWDGQSLNGFNIIASFNPEAKKRVIIAAHWDTRYMAEKDTDADKTNMPIPGADDGASGTAVALEIARQLGRHPLPGLGVDIVLFDLEDQGNNGEEYPHTYALGSQLWAKNYKQKPKARWGILLDMVGAANARFPREQISYINARSLSDKVWKLAQSMGHGNIFINEEGGAIFDDHYYVIRDTKIPMIDIINMQPGSSFGSYHHTHDDNLDIISKRTLNTVGQVTLAAIYRYHNGTL